MPTRLPVTASIHERIQELADEGYAVRDAGSAKLIHRLRDNARQILRAYQLLTQRIASRAVVPLESEWLLDNYYVIDDVIRQVSDHLPGSYYRELPVRDGGPHNGFPRIYLLAHAIVERGEKTLSEPDIHAAVDDYQQTTALTMGELWAVPIMLRIAVIELIRVIVDDIVRSLEDAEHSRRDLRASRRLPDSPSDAYTSALWEYYQGQETHTANVEAWMSIHLADPHMVLQREFARQAANQVSIGNGVTTLRLLNIIDWKQFFEATSLVESTLRLDPAGIYARQDFVTRDRCRHAVEVLARRSGRPEVDVAQSLVVGFAATTDADGRSRSHR
jgi:cyclic beta-1,2-glucan synthetase